MSASDFSELENIYRALVKELPYAAGLYIGREMRISQVNQAMLDIWDKDRSVIGKNYRDILPELDGQPFFQLYDNVFTSGKTYSAKEKRVDLLRHGKMEPFYFNFTYKALKDKEGKPWAILTTAVDVTELVNTKRNLGQAREDVRFALDAAELGTWVLHPDTNNVNLDLRCRILHGLDGPNGPDEITLDEISNNIYEPDRQRVLLATANALKKETQTAFDVEFRVKTKTGVRWLRSKGKASFAIDGSVYRFAGTTQDITEDKILQREQRKLTEIIENSEDLIGVTDLSGNVTYLNKAGQQLLGLDGPEAYCRPASDYMITKDLAKLREAMVAATHGSGRYSGEIRYRSFKTGEIIPCQINAFVLHDEDTGEPIGMATVTRDLRAEKARRKEQRKLLTLVENSADMMSVLENNGINSYINKAGRELIGLSDNEVLSTHISALHRPEDFEFVKDEILTSITNHGRWAGKMIIKHYLTGELIPVFNSSVRIDDPVTGEAIAVGAMMRDLRPEIMAQQALTDSEELFRGITTAAPTALWVSDENMSLRFINQTWINWTGIPLEQNLGQGWLGAIVDEDRAKAGERYVNDFSERRKHESQFRINAVDGQRWVICTGNPQYRADGTFSGYIGACVDITELKHLQNQKDEFIGIASHELKTPVTSIKAYAQVLELMFKRDGDEKKSEMLRKMDNQVNRLTNLITDLLDVTRIQTGKLEYDRSAFDFNQLVNELAEDLQHTTKRHTIRTVTEGKIEVIADRERIGQVIINFISNAIKYSPESDQIMVYADQRDNNVFLRVQDFGIGIPADKKDHVFEQFYRVNNDKQYTFPGLGLGLYISSEIIKREGGKIWVESEEGKGSSFCFTLPLK